MNELVVLVFGDLTEGSEKAGLNFRNYMLIKRLYELKVIKQIICFSVTPNLPFTEVDICQFRFSYLSKINTVLNKFLPKILGDNLYAKYFNRLQTEILFDLFCFLKIKVKNGTGVLDLKSLSYLTLQKVKRRQGKFFFFAPVCHPTEEFNQIEAFCRKNKLVENSPYSNELRTKLYAKYVKETSLVIPLLPSKYVTQTYIDNGISPLKIKSPSCPWGIHPSFFMDKDKTYLRNNKLTFLCISGGSHKKGIKLLLDAWVLTKPVNAELWVVGSQNNNENYTGIESIHWLPYSSNIQEYFRLSGVFVCPSVIDLGPRAVFEAMAAGLVVIVSDKCGSAEFVSTDNGYIFTSGSIQDLEYQLQKCLNQRNQIIKLGQKANLDALNFKTETYIESIINIVMPHNA